MAIACFPLSYLQLDCEVFDMCLSQITVREALNSALDEELERDDSVFVLGEEVKPHLFPKLARSQMLSSPGAYRLWRVI